MKIINVTTNWFRGLPISKTFLFDDDTSVDISNDDNSIEDIDGMMVVPNSKIKLIENKMNITIKP